MNCSLCEQHIRFIHHTKTRCEHQLHDKCLAEIAFQKVPCTVCNKTITSNATLRYNFYDEPCHEFCTKGKTRRNIKRCPLCDAKASTKNIMTQKETEELMDKIKDLDYEQRVPHYLDYGFLEEEVQQPSLTDSEWDYILSCLNPKKEEEIDETKPISSTTKNKTFVIPELKTYEPRELEKGERYKPPSKHRRLTEEYQEREASFENPVPRHLKQRVHVHGSTEFALFSQFPSC